MRRPGCKTSAEHRQPILNLVFTGVDPEIGVGDGRVAGEMGRCLTVYHCDYGRFLFGTRLKFLVFPLIAVPRNMRSWSPGPAFSGGAR